MDPASPVSFVVGSGPSVDSYDKKFLSNLMDQGTVFGINNVALDVPCHYNVRKSFGAETKLPDELPNYEFANPNCKLVISEFDCGDSSRALSNLEIKGDYFFFSHQNNQSMGDPILPDDDQIIVSWSTISSALHLAASLGSKVIYVIGNDLRGSNYSGYYQAPGPAYWQFRHQIISIKKYIHSEFGCSVVNLSPFSGIGYASDNVSKVKVSIGKIQYFLKFHLFDKWRL